MPGSLPKQGSLLADIEKVALPGRGCLYVYRSWIVPLDAKVLQDYLVETLSWQQPEIRVAGKLHRIPRQQVWLGDSHANFTYSGVTFHPQRLPDTLTNYVSEISTLAAQVFNSVLVNRYRDGSDSVGWHADDEPEFGDNPIIASLSLGATRRFSLKPKPAYYSLCGWKPRQRAMNIDLAHGDLLIMDRDVQPYWLHSIPKQIKVKQERINLTFRHVDAS